MKTGKTNDIAVVPETGTKGGNYEPIRFNAMKHGVLSKLVVLPHEDSGEFADLLAALVEEYQPNGQTEQYLVEDLAGIMWRKRRILLAEGAKINSDLETAVNRGGEAIIREAVAAEGWSPEEEEISLHDVLATSEEEAIEAQRDAEQELEATRKAARILESGNQDAYKKALRALTPDSREGWERKTKNKPQMQTAKGLQKFIREHLEPIARKFHWEAAHQTAIKAQILGKSLQTIRFQSLNRYETHLDRKFERTLAMLLKIKQMRAEAPAKSGDG
uniref:Uncharacterized protein n=1 Tax=Candidatus Kentrum sp. LPFa TaxID=2126335 RepID=A0A450W356_9GAMM|nr:MAG: hypothetical protein BECKLPF1236A_GA0070988_1005614 [Candidatus Kentron sp. LPFa]VFK27686.1 MAG: hypothetical protein BECKLPF1236C_GA0070990_1005014 [Candidatus Kentron sp. LPFa]